MIKAFLYDAEAKDCETSLAKGLPQLGDQQLLWIEVTGRDPTELDQLCSLLKLAPQSRAALATSNRSFELNNYGEYFQFDVVSLEPDGEAHASSLRVPKALKTDFIVSRQWLVTVHDEDLQYLAEFRDQDRGETLIGNLSPASLAASLLDWHLNVYLTAMEQLEAFVDRLDVQMLAGKSIRDNLLLQVVSGRRFVSSLGRMLGPQRSVF